MQTPLRDPTRTPKHLSSGAYNRIPALTVYKTYPVYAPGREPAGYIERLRGLEPEIAFHPDRVFVVLLLVFLLPTVAVVEEDQRV